MFDGRTDNYPPGGKKKILPGGCERKLTSNVVLKIERATLIALLYTETKKLKNLHSKQQSLSVSKIGTAAAAEEEEEVDHSTLAGCTNVSPLEASLWFKYQQDS